MINSTKALESNWQPTLIFYGCAFFLIIIGAQLSPTNLAGPGLDMIFIFMAMLGNVVLLSRSVFRLIKQDKVYRLAVLIHGAVFTFWFGFLMIALIYSLMTK